MTKIRVTGDLEDVHGFEDGETVAIIIKGIQYIAVCRIDGEDYVLEPIAN